MSADFFGHFLTLIRNDPVPFAYPVLSLEPKYGVFVVCEAEPCHGKQR